MIELRVDLGMMNSTQAEDALSDHNIVNELKSYISNINLVCISARYGRHLGIAYPHAHRTHFSPSARAASSRVRSAPPRRSPRTAFTSFSS